MRIRWLSIAERDISRLYDFLQDVNPRAAATRIGHIVVSAGKLLDHPRLGHSLDVYAPRDVRSLIIGDYELRYEVAGDEIIVLRVWHTREDR